MTPAERETMRTRLRAAIAGATLPDATVDHPGVYRPADAPAGDLAARFRTELTALGGVVHDAEDVASVAAIVLRRLEGAPVRAVLMWDDASMPVAGLATALERAGVAVRRQTPETVASDADRRALAEIPIGITGATAALAETGSIVVVSGPGRDRLASLLPPVHIAIVARATLLPSLATLVARDPQIFTAGTNVVVITGPSRTADIEHTLSRGVHGPGEVHVVFV